MPLDEWPDPVNRAFAAINQSIYVPIQGPSELGAGGVLLTWDRTEDLARITVPTLVISSHHDTMDPDWMRMMVGKLPNGSRLYCPNGSHMAMYDDQKLYFEGLIDFIATVERDAAAG
jgi:proline iminopeptidase